MTPERWRQIEALYHAARQRAVNERVAFLADACRGDADLQREVESLLGQPDSGAGLLAGPGFGAAARLATGGQALGPGRSLGLYQLQTLIGVGGMGEVYRARDGKLGREVAIKVLPHAFTSDSMRLARFEREARTLAALNHPNICSIYGFEEAEHVQFLILELVDGYTLADRLASARQRPDGPGLPQREALGVARQIARALDFAHDRGIVHRDLKPANVKITTDGSVKVLDFGLAKAVTGDAAGADLAPLPTVTSDHTIDGAIIGTPAYMSPEQARGLPVDKRTDIWAFGCVLYEMLTGRTAFSADTAADTIAKVLEREPDWTALPAATPEPIRNLLFGCLAKDPRERLRDIGDVRITIDSILSGSSSPTISPSAVQPIKPRTAWLPWALAAALAVALVGLTVWSFRPPPPSPPGLRYSTITLPPGQGLDRSGGAHVLSISHSGRQLAYVASGGLLYLRSTDEKEGKAIPGTQALKGVREPRFSPDDKEIVFYSFVDKWLKQMPVSGGTAQEIIRAETPTGIDWWPSIILYGQGRKGIYRVSPNGGPSRVVASIEKDEEAHGPQVLPDGDHFIFTVAKDRGRDRWDNAQIVVASLSNPKDRKPLEVKGSDARYVHGHLVYAISGIVYAVPFDEQTRQVTGDRFVVQEGVSRAGGAVTGAANFSVSDTGLFVYVPGPVDAVSESMELSLIDPKGSLLDTNGRAPRKLKLPADPYDSFRVSPDESQIAFGNERDKEWTIRTFALSGADSDQPLTTSGSNRYPAWTRNSKRIAFQSNRGGDDAIWWQAADRSDNAQRLTTPNPGESHIPESWFGETLLYSSTNEDGEATLWTLSVRNGKPEPETLRRFGTTASTEPMSAVFSPNGKLVAYTKGERNGITICVEAFPSTGRECLVPKEPADTPKHPQWWPGSDRLDYNPRIGGFESVRVTTQPLDLGTPEPVEYHPFRLGPPGSRTAYDVTSTGKFVGLTTPGQPGYAPQFVNEIQVVVNWFDVLKEKARR